MNEGISEYSSIDSLQPSQVVCDLFVTCFLWAAVTENRAWAVIDSATSGYVKTKGTEALLGLPRRAFLAVPCIGEESKALEMGSKAR